MGGADETFERVPFPPERRLVLDTLRLGRGKPMMHGLVELDVTLARTMLREHKERTGESVSFTAFALACVGRAVAAHPEVHALRDWRGRLVRFADVDATTIVEVAIEGRAFPLAHVVRAINRRGVRELHDELRALKGSGGRAVAGRARVGTRLFLMLPGVVRRWFYRALLCSPRRARRHTGTLLVSALGMLSGGTAGWGLSAPGLHDFAIIMGGVTSRPAITDGEGAVREVLCLTVSANHEIVDGAPLARFTRELARLLAAAEGLAEALRLPPRS